MPQDQSGRPQPCRSRAPVGGRPSGPGSLQLTGGEWKLDHPINWRIEGQDPERAYSLDRWNWLLLALTRDTSVTAEWGWHLVRDWLTHCGAETRGGRIASYNLGERIVNACLFCSASGGSQEVLPDDIAASLKPMAALLAANLEYSQPELTGNHVLNNARALFFADRYLGMPGYADLAAHIFQERLPVLITADGFLREGSSHYQFLVTRWLLEIHWLAERTEDGVCEFLRPYLESCLRRCWFFLVRQHGDWTTPLIGDVSPDFPPDWLISVPWSPVAIRIHRPSILPSRPRKKGWLDLWGGSDENGKADGTSKAARQFQCFPESHWYRLDWEGWTVFWHVEPSDVLFHASHAHADATSFVLFRGGFPIFVDPGRFSYQADHALGRYGASGAAHNGVVLDECDPVLGPRSGRFLGRLPHWYRKVRINVHWREETDRFTFTIDHDGFSRLCGTRLDHRRTFVAEKDSFTVEDLLGGKGRHNLSAHFHCAPDIDAKQSCGSGSSGWKLSDARWPFQAMLELENGNTPARRETAKGRMEPSPGGWFFPAYGVKQPATTLTYRWQAELPFSARFRLEIIPLTN
jgi:hypothetical protein